MRSSSPTPNLLQPVLSMTIHSTVAMSCMCQQQRPTVFAFLFVPSTNTKLHANEPTNHNLHRTAFSSSPSGRRHSAHVHLCLRNVPLPKHSFRFLGVFPHLPSRTRKCFICRNHHLCRGRSWPTPGPSFWIFAQPPPPARAIYTIHTTRRESLLLAHTPANSAAGTTHNPQKQHGRNAQQKNMAHTASV